MTGPVLSTPLRYILQIIRNLTGRVDFNDPAFTDSILIDYLNRFVQQHHPQEIQIYENRTWWDFTVNPTTPDPLVVDLDALGFSYINAPAFINTTGLKEDAFELVWYQDPKEYYIQYPLNVITTPQMPRAVLYYNNELKFSSPIDKTYNIRISAYKIDYSFAGGTLTNTSSILNSTSQFPDSPRAYLTTYFAHGAALLILSEYGEMDRYNEVYQVFRKYKNQVLARTWFQLSSQRTKPDF